MKHLNKDTTYEGKVKKAQDPEGRKPMTLRPRGIGSTIAPQLLLSFQLWSSVWMQEKSTAIAANDRKSREYFYQILMGQFFAT